MNTPIEFVILKDLTIYKVLGHEILQPPAAASE